MAKQPRQPSGGGTADAVLDRLISQTAEKEFVPSPADRNDGGEVVNVARTEAYLKKFGYMRSANLEAFGLPQAVLDALPTPTGRYDENLREGLRRFQVFNHLPVSGELDDATLARMSMPRCGFPDIPSTADAFTAQGSRWNTNNVTYGFQNFTADLTEAEIRTAIQQALALWAAVTPLNFTEVPFGSTPDIVIRFVSADHGDGNAFDGAGAVLAHAFYPPPGGGAFAGDTHFDEAETWTVSTPPTGIDLVTVAAHEFGHALGLAHSTVAGALMEAFYAGAHRNLEADDVAGIRSIYGGRGGWASLGGVITSRISVARNSDGRLEIFARGTDNALWHQWQTAPNNGWSGWSSLGGFITSDPVVINNADGRLEVFARGSDNAVWHRWQTAPSNGWSAGWSSLGGIITSQIAVVRNADGRIEIFARGTDKAVWHRWQTAPSNGWAAGWSSLGGIITSNIAARRNADGRIEIFARGTDNALWHRWQTAPSNGWSAGWSSLGGIITADPTVINNADGRLEVFVRGTDNAVWHRWQTAPSNGWSAGWSSLGGIINREVAPGNNADGRIELFVQGTDSAVWHRWQTAPNNGWS